MTNHPKEQRPKFTGQKRLKIGEEIDQLSKKSEEEILEFFRNIDKMNEEADKEHQLGLAAAAKEKNDGAGAGSSSGPSPYKITKPRTKRPRRMPPDEVLARLSQVAQYDPKARKLWQKWCSGKW